MFYNLLNYPTAPPSNRNLILKDILNSYQPDIFMVCELESDIASMDILTTSLAGIGKNYDKASFVLNQSDTNPHSSLQQLVYYNKDYLILDNQNLITTSIRDINHYTFILKTDDHLTNPIYLEVFVAHLKSSDGTTNKQLRLQMVNEFTTFLESLNPNSFVVFAGDFNFYTSSEPGYQEIIDTTNAIVIKDILNLDNSLQSWHNNDIWKHLHTQATRTSNSAFNGHGAYGGMDDRFDFIMLSENMLTNPSLHYVLNSYQNYGNNGNCYNKRIDDTDCYGDFSATLRNNLYLMSDHLPVVLELESTQTLHTLNNLTKLNLIKFANGNLITDNLPLVIDSKLLGSNLHIYNTLAQKVLKVTINSELLHIKTSSFSNGVYFIRVDNFNTIFKFIVKK